MWEGTRSCDAGGESSEGKNWDALGRGGVDSGLRLLLPPVFRAALGVVIAVVCSLVGSEISDYHKTLRGLSEWRK